MTFVILLTGSLAGLFGQQETQFTQYMYNTTSLNPAYAGSRGQLSINGFYRSQWVGLDGAPTTQSVSLNGPLGYKTGIGATLINDKIGPVTEITATGDFAYALPIGPNGTKLALGLKAGVYNFEVDISDLSIFDPTTSAFQQDIQSQFAFIFGAGAYLYNDKAYIGVSAPSIFETIRYDDETTAVAPRELHVYGMAGYVFEMAGDIEFKPTALLKTVEGRLLSLDLSANARWREQVTLGLSYRWDSSFSVLAGFNVNQRTMIGYAYDFDTTALSSFNGGSHEVFLRFDLGSNAQGKMSPRFF